METWLRKHALDFSADLVVPDSLGARLDAARIIFLGETNHFVEQKTDFRINWLRALRRRGPLVIAEEIGWADGRRIRDFILGGRDEVLRQAATFGSRHHERADRNDTPTGILAPNAYPHTAMLQEHRKLYEWLRNEGAVEDYFGFDIDAPGAGYADVEAGRVDGETIAEEIERLSALVPNVNTEALIDSLEYARMIDGLEDYEAVRPAMAFREEAMKRRVEAILSMMEPNAKLVLMAHAFHLARDDTHIEQQGIGPGGGLTPSLGHHLARDRSGEIASIWMVYGGGRDAQPLPYLPTEARYSRNSLNARLLEQFNDPVVVPLTDNCPSELRKVRIGHLYNLEVEVDLASEADAITFFPQVTPIATNGA